MVMDIASRPPGLPVAHRLCNKTAEDVDEKEGGTLMKRVLTALATLALVALAPAARADSDPLGDLIATVTSGNLPGTPDWQLRATLYHIGAVGVGTMDALGCRVVAMRTVAVDPHLVPRRTLLFIPETVGLLMPDGRHHDGYWYASDTGGAIRGNRIDLFTGRGPASMRPMMRFNSTTLSVRRVGVFRGCPPS
jgi:3D (Asp-Asp-Asp) domain-containing protein